MADDPIHSVQVMHDVVDDVVHVIARGELDISNVDELATIVTEVCAGEPDALVFDFTELRYCDSRALHVLINAAQSCAEHGTHMSIRGAHGTVRRVLEIADLVEVLGVEAV